MSSFLHSWVSLSLGHGFIFVFIHLLSPLASTYYSSLVSSLFNPVYPKSASFTLMLFSCPSLYSILHSCVLSVWTGSIRLNPSTFRSEGLISQISGSTHCRKLRDKVIYSGRRSISDEGPRLHRLWRARSDLQVDTHVLTNQTSKLIMMRKLIL